MMIEFNTFEEYAAFMGGLSESVAQDFAVEPEEALAVLLCVPPEEVEAILAGDADALDIARGISKGVDRYLRQPGECQLMGDILQFPKGVALGYNSPQVATSARSWRDVPPHKSDERRYKFRAEAVREWEKSYSGSFPVITVENNQS